MLLTIGRSGMPSLLIFVNPRNLGRAFAFCRSPLMVSFRSPEVHWFFSVQFLVATAI